MRVSKVVPALLAFAFLVCCIPQLYAQMTTQAEAPGGECYKCTRVFGGQIGICDDVLAGGTGMTYCQDSNWDCVMSGNHCAVIFQLALLADESSPTVAGLEGGSMRLVAIAPYLWAGADCKDGVRTFVSTDPDVAAGLVELTPRSTELALR